MTTIIQTVDRSAAITLDVLDPCEQDTILSADQQGAALVIIDDLLGRQVATVCGLKTTATTPGALAASKLKNWWALPTSS